MKRIGRLLARHERFVVRYAMTYGRWAARHEPYSFAIYPLVGLAAPLIWWIGVGAGAGIIVLAIVESLTILFCVYLFYVRRRRLPG